MIPAALLSLVVLTGTTSGASTTAGTCYADRGPAPEAMHTWTATADGTATASVAADWDSTAYVRDAAGREVACNDDATAPWASRFTWTVTAGSTWRVYVDGYAGGSGPYRLEITGPDAPTQPTDPCTPKFPRTGPPCSTVEQRIPCACGDCMEWDPAIDAEGYEVRRQRETDGPGTWCVAATLPVIPAWVDEDGAHPAYHPGVWCPAEDSSICGMPVPGVVYRYSVRTWRGSPRVYSTAPPSILYGAAGYRCFETGRWKGCEE